MLTEQVPAAADSAVEAAMVSRDAKDSAVKNEFDLHALIDATNAQLFQAFVGDPSRVHRFRDFCTETEFFWTGNRLNVRLLAGERMTDKASLMNEFDAAFQMRYFGRNWDSLDDWITFLGWLPPGAGYVTFITHADRVLERDPGERATLVALLRGAGQGWAHTVTEGATRGRPPVPFHVVLAGNSFEEITAAWGDGLARIDS
jgi:hypothetical protein